MDNPRPEKVAVVDEVRERIDAADGVVLTDFRGLDVPAIAELRRSIRDAGGEYKVYKNTLVRFAARELELEIEELLVGPTAYAFTATRPDGTRGDPVSVAKALAEFAKTNENLVIKGGLLDGKILDVDEVNALAKIAPREELLARFAGGLAAPMQKFAGLLAAVPQNFAYALRALIDQGGGPDAAPPEPVAEEAPEAEEPPAEEAPEAEAAETAAAPEAETPEAEAADAAPEAAADDDTETETETEAQTEEAEAASEPEEAPASDDADSTEET